ncbi:MAG TPA: hypothetical protein VFV35_00810 [Acidimicrobiales bacterium]|nr:hypothetical protein [Acidimicrobiales bacterium]
MENAVAAASSRADVATSLALLHKAGRGYRAVGAVGADEVEAIVGLAEFALFLRGTDWVGVAFPELPRPASPERGELVSVSAGDGALVELWEHAVVVTTEGGDSYEMAAGVPAEHDWMEIRTASGHVSVDLSTGVPARPLEARARPMGWGDAVAVWAALEGHGDATHEGDPTAENWGFEPLALVGAGPLRGLTIVGIEGSRLLHLRSDMPAAAAWFVSPAGSHVVCDGRLVDPPLPPPPAPIRLVLVDGGTVLEAAVR